MGWDKIVLLLLSRIFKITEFFVCVRSVVRPSDGIQMRMKSLKQLRDQDWLIAFYFREILHDIIIYGTF